MDNWRFSDEAFNEAKHIYTQIDDFSNRPIVSGITIDGKTSKDLDDGINLTKSGDNFILEVSIADVAEYVKPGSPLFDDSIARAATIYRPFYNIPMIPRLLSEDRLSLLPGQTRPAITFTLTISSELEVIDIKIQETLFFSARRLSYDEFDYVVRKPIEDPDKELFIAMNSLAQSLLQKRRENGALAIYDLRKGIYTDEEGVLRRLSAEGNHLANIVIQEFMIITNSNIAMYFAKNDYPFVYRNHTARISAPDRGELLEQLDTALNAPKYFDLLRTRAGLWFNRANYGVRLIGHFGLNIPAYSHVTSPIRRAADLLNHILIKTFIADKEPVFEFEKLKEHVQNTNAVINARKDVVSDKYKKLALKENLEKIAATSEADLIAMELGDFERLLNVAMKQDLKTDTLKSAIAKRIASGKMEASAIHTFLFKALDDWKSEINLRKQALRFLLKQKGLAVQILNTLVQKEDIDRYAYEIVEYDKGFKVKTSGRKNDEEFTTPNFSSAQKKKDAVSDSSAHFIAVLLGLDFKTNTDLIQGESEEYFELGNPEIKSENNEHGELCSIMPDENYVGLLTELASKHSEWKAIQCDYKLTGANHCPNVECKVVLETPDAIYEDAAWGTNKKIAKQHAYKLIFLKVKHLIPERNQTAKPTSESRNYVGELQELCVKNEIMSPTYQFKEMKIDKTSYFEANIILVFKGEPKLYTYSDIKKSVAKQGVAQKCLEFLISELS